MKVVLTSAYRVGSTWTAEILSAILECQWDSLNSVIWSTPYRSRYLRPGDPPSLELEPSICKSLMAVRDFHSGVCKTHNFLPSTLLPILGPELKLVTITRHSYDALVSLFMYCRHHRVAQGEANDPWFEEFIATNIHLSDGEFMNHLVHTLPNEVCELLMIQKRFREIPESEFIMSLRYEDLMEHPKDTIYKLARFMERTPSVGQINSILETTSKEALSAKFNKDYEGQTKFIREARSNQWQDTFDDVSVGILNSLNL